jgi:hypothetical protein
MRIIVCGGRNFRDRRAVFDALDRLHAKRGIDFLIQGGAHGADYLAWQWANVRGVPCGSYPADWDTLGRKAGPIRNQQMIDEGCADGVIAFPGSKGTADMITRARRAGLTVWEPLGQRCDL